MVARAALPHAWGTPPRASVNHSSPSPSSPWSACSMRRTSSAGIAGICDAPQAVLDLLDARDPRRRRVVQQGEQRERADGAGRRLSQVGRSVEALLDELGRQTFHGAGRRPDDDLAQSRDHQAGVALHLLEHRRLVLGQVVEVRTEVESALRRVRHRQPRVARWCTPLLVHHEPVDDPAVLRGGGAEPQRARVGGADAGVLAGDGLDVDADPRVLRAVPEPKALVPTVTLHGARQVETCGVRQEADDVEQGRRAGPVGPDEHVERTQGHVHVPQAAVVAHTEPQQVGRSAVEHRSRVASVMLRPDLCDGAISLPCRS